MASRRKIGTIQNIPKTEPGFDLGASDTVLSTVNTRDLTLSTWDWTPTDVSLPIPRDGPNQSPNPETTGLLTSRPESQVLNHP